MVYLRIQIYFKNMVKENISQKRRLKEKRNFLVEKASKMN